MMMDEAVLCVCFSRDSEMLATGSQGGKVKVWRLSSGACLRRFEMAHGKGVTSVQFSREGTQVLTASFDHSARIHGLKSAKTLKEFNGHQSFVNVAIYSQDGLSVITGSSDGTVKIWNTKTTECITTMNQFGTSTGVAIAAISLWPHHGNQIVVCNRSNTVHVVNFQGQTIKTFTNGKMSGGDFLTCVTSSRGDWLYCAAEDNTLYCFNTANGNVETLSSTHEREMIGVACHPHQNYVATFAEDEVLKLWID